MDEVNMENNTVSPLLIKKLSLATSILFTLSMQHYCHPKTNKKYLQADMNTEEMYNLYNKECEEISRHRNLSITDISLVITSTSTFQSQKRTDVIALKKLN